MKICVAQTHPVKGDIDKNIQRHVDFVNRALVHHSSLILFPELSLTGYEPSLAKHRVFSSDDIRLNIFQELSDASDITIGVGVPTKSATGVCISLIMFQPGQRRKTYSKKYLHPDEEEFFVSGSNVSGSNFSGVNVKGYDVALAICYEISVREHLESACKSGASIYMASVAKFAHGIDKALITLTDTACGNFQLVLMSNSVGLSDGHVCAGKSSVWDNNGRLIAQLNEKDEGIIIVDVESKKSITEMV
jgi:predicted amidohydrolase